MLPTELLCDIVSFLARHDLDVLKLVDAALNGLVDARFDDYPLRPLKLTADANIIRVEEQPVEAGRFVEVHHVGRWPEQEHAQYVHAQQQKAALLKRYIQRSFISHLTLEETFTHSAVYVLKPIWNTLRNAICVMPLDVQGSACEHALSELLYCKEILFGGSQPSVRDDAWTLVHARFFRFACWSLCHVLRFNHVMLYGVDELVGWLLSGGERVFTSERERGPQVKLIVEQLQNQFVTATTPTSFLLNLTYNLRPDDFPLAASLRENAGTGERLEVDVSADDAKVIVLVRRFVAP